MPTKYARQIKSARATIIRKGTTCLWSKDTDVNTGDDTSPEFPSNDAPTVYSTPIVLYPSTRIELATAIASIMNGSFKTQLLGLIPGDVPYTPEIDDAVKFTNPDASTFILHVADVNTVQPDLYPIIHEITFK